MSRTKVLSLLCGNMPEWYRISAGGGDPNLRVWMKRDAWNKLLRIDWEGATIRSGFPADAPFHNCGKEATAFFGFNGVASCLFHGHAEDPDSNVILDFDLKTTVYDPASGWKKPDHQAIFHLSATLSLLFAALEFISVDSRSNNSQLLVVKDFVTKTGMRGGSFNADLSAEVMEWLAAKGRLIEWPELMEPAIRAYHAMAGNEPGTHFESWFEVYVEIPLGVHFKVPPGGAMFQMAHPWDAGTNYGAEFWSVDVDPLISQVTLLVVLGRLCDLYRQDAGIN